MRRLAFVAFGIIAILALLLYFVRFQLLGVAQGEVFYKGYPTSYWRMQIRTYLQIPMNKMTRENTPQILSALEENDLDAIPVMLELAYDEDSIIREIAVVQLDMLRPKDKKGLSEGSRKKIVKALSDYTLFVKRKRDSARSKYDDTLLSLRSSNKEFNAKVEEVVRDLVMDPEQSHRSSTGDQIAEYRGGHPDHVLGALFLIGTLQDRDPAARKRAAELLEKLTSDKLPEEVKALATKCLTKYRQSK